VSLLLVALLAAPASAPEARFLEDLARRETRRGNLREALVLFSELIEVAPDPINVYNAALTADAVGERRLAFSLFERFLRMDAEKDPARLSVARSQRDALAARLAIVEVRSSPSGARIFVDGLERGIFDRTPATLALSPGAHVIRTELVDHHPATATVAARRGERRSVETELVPFTGQLEVRIVDADVRNVEIQPADGTTRTIPVGRPVELPVGRYRLVVDHPGFEIAEFVVAVPANRTERRRVTLVPMPPATGRVLVSTGKVNAALFIDGELRASTPVAVDIPVGVHRLEVRVGDEVVWSDRVLVIEGMSSLYRVELDDEA